MTLPDLELTESSTTTEVAARLLELGFLAEVVQVLEGMYTTLMNLTLYSCLKCITDFLYGKS